MERHSRLQPSKRRNDIKVADALNRRIDIHTCRQHHVAIRFLLDEFAEIGKQSPDQTRELLDRIGSLLRRHFKLEDQHVYPSLSESEDGDVRSTALEFRLKMGNLLQRFEDLYGFWTARQIAHMPLAFVDEWRAFRDALVARMDAEDAMLYPKAEAHLQLQIASQKDTAQ